MEHHNDDYTPVKRTNAKNEDKVVMENDLKSSSSDSEYDAI